MIAYLTADGLTCNFEALYIGIVKFMFTGPASFVRFPVFQKMCHKKDTQHRQATAKAKCIPCDSWENVSFARRVCSEPPTICEKLNLFSKIQQNG
jgi:hypothetical protein